MALAALVLAGCSDGDVVLECRGTRYAPYEGTLPDSFTLRLRGDQSAYCDASDCKSEWTWQKVAGVEGKLITLRDELDPDGDRHISRHLDLSSGVVTGRVTFKKQGGPDYTWNASCVRR